MIPLLLWGCDTPAALYPVDPCRVGALFDDVAGEATCTLAGHTIEASFEWASTTRVGGVQGESWEGLSFYATGTSDAGATVSVGHRPAGGVGAYARDGAVELVSGFLPSGSEDAGDGYVLLTDATGSCDGSGDGSIHLAGLPREWVTDGEWRSSFSAGSIDSDGVSSEWVSPWPATCPLDPRAWATVRVSARCGEATGAEIQFLAPGAFSVELDALGGVAGVSATWADAFSATCDGAELDSLDGSLQGEDGALRLYTPVLTVTRDAEGVWALESSACGECPDGWEVEVEGLPEL